MSREFDLMWQDVSRWGLETFPNPTAEGICNHIKEELDEILADPRDKSEYADVMILLIQLCTVANLTGSDLINEVREKMKINKQRKWEKPDEQGIVRHKK